MRDLAACVVILITIVSSCYAGDQRGDFPVLRGPCLGQEAPGMKPEIFASGIVSTDLYNHCSVSIAPDGSEIYWAMAPLDTPRRIYVSRMIDGKWSKPSIVHFTESDDGDCPVLSPDGNRLFFNSNRPLPSGTTPRERIWCTERTTEGWGDPFPLSAVINDAHLHWQVSIDNAGNLYFGSEREGSKGRDDVFVAELVNDQYRKPVSLGSAINSDAHEGCPYVAPDGSYLIFARGGLWISFKQENDRWMKAIWMGDDFTDAVCPYVSPDGQFLFFLRMGRGFNDVWWVDARVIEELRPDL